MKIVVLAGGFSMERNVSLTSSISIAKALRAKGYEVALVDSFLGVDDKNVSKIFELEFPESWEQALLQQPDLLKLSKERTSKNNALLGQNVLEICKKGDIVFIGLHGGYGEDGRIQAALDLLGIPYTGSNYLGSGIGMNKEIAKSVVKKAGVNVPDWDEIIVADEFEATQLMKKYDVPVVVKKTNSGSSVGVYVCRTKEELLDAFKHSVGCKVMVEQFIDGREIQKAFLGDTILPSVEIIANDDFFSYDSKYKGMATEKSPADISEDQENEMGEILLNVVHAVGLKVYARADFIIDHNGKIWFIEINTLPGMCPNSLIVLEAASAGLEFGDLCEHIIQDSLKEKVGIKKELDDMMQS